MCVTGKIQACDGEILTEARWCATEFNRLDRKWAAKLIGAMRRAYSESLPWKLSAGKNAPYRVMTRMSKCVRWKGDDLAVSQYGQTCVLRQPVFLVQSGHSLTSCFQTRRGHGPAQKWGDGFAAGVLTAVSR